MNISTFFTVCFPLITCYWNASCHALYIFVFDRFQCFKSFPLENFKLKIKLYSSYSVNFLRLSVFLLVWKESAVRSCISSFQLVFQVPYPCYLNQFLKVQNNWVCWQWERLPSIRLSLASEVLYFSILDRMSPNF